MREHNENLAVAFDGQAERFEKAPVQTDRAALHRLLEFAGFPEGSRLIDAGCGPGLVAEVFLEAGHSVDGVDLSAAMVRRAVARNLRFGDRASFRQASLFEDQPSARYDAAYSRYVLHHVEDPRAFLRRQVELVVPGGLVVLSDQVTDPDGRRASWHQSIERDRDRTHTRHLAPGEILDRCAEAGLCDLRLTEEPFALDFDEWFDRGTPAVSKQEVRDRLLSGPGPRGFRPTLLEGGAVRIDCVRVLVRGRTPLGPT